MNGYHFFACMPEGRKSKSPSRAFPERWNRATLRAMAEAGKLADCIAVDTDRNHWFVSPHGGLMMEAVTGVYSRENSPCCSSAVSRDWCATRCVRIDEALARKLHPALFAYLDA